MKNIPYYFSIIQLVALLILIINHASRGLHWEPLLFLLLPMLSMYYAEQRDRNRRFYDRSNVWSFIYDKRNLLYHLINNVMVC